MLAVSRNPGAASWIRSQFASARRMRSPASHAVFRLRNVQQNHEFLATGAERHVALAGRLFQAPGNGLAAHHRRPSVPRVSLTFLK
jgi:hypothetical protein